MQDNLLLMDLGEASMFASPPGNGFSAAGKSGGIDMLLGPTVGPISGSCNVGCGVTTTVDSSDPDPGNSLNGTSFPLTPELTLHGERVTDGRLTLPDEGQLGIRDGIDARSPKGSKLKKGLPRCAVRIEPIFPNADDGVVNGGISVTEVSSAELRTLMMTLILPVSRKTCGRPPNTSTKCRAASMFI